MRPEFDLITRHFNRTVARSDVVLGVGDDAAILSVPPGQELMVSMDTLVAGVHFFADADPAGIGHKALAVNLSDMAAMGAEPAWVTLALTLPVIDDAWLTRFSAGFHALAQSFGVTLVGGDTTRGPLAITVQIHGFAPPAAAFRRDHARAGDAIYVTGTLGDAGLALACAADRLDAGSPAQRAWLCERLEKPAPRVREALRLRGLAHAAIDISDGLYADLGHVLAASGVGATLALDELPLSPTFRAVVALPAVAGALRTRFGEGRALLPWAELALGAGDDYELCFTAPPAHGARIEAALDAAGCAWTRIGVIDERPGLRCVRAEGDLYEPRCVGYDHFAGTSGGGGRS